MTRRGALLLEVLLSVALFVIASLAILSIVREAVGRLEDGRDRLAAADIAHSAMAAIDAGLYEPSALDGPFPTTGLFSDEEILSGSVAAAPDPGSGWVLEVESERSQFPGLTMVEIAVRRDDARDTTVRSLDDPAPVYALRRLVALGDDEDTDTDAVAPPTLEGGP